MRLYSPDITKPTEVNYYWHEKVLIEPMPEPKQEWIPVSERLPEKEGVYLVSCYGETYFDTLCGFFEGDDGESLCEWDISVNVPYEDLAWMDLPAPWKGASDDY